MLIVLAQAGSLDSAYPETREYRALQLGGRAGVGAGIEAVQQVRRVRIGHNRRKQEKDSQGISLLIKTNECVFNRSLNFVFTLKGSFQADLIFEVLCSGKKDCML